MKAPKEWKRYRVFDGELPRVVFRSDQHDFDIDCDQAVHCRLNREDNTILIDRNCYAYQLLLVEFMELGINPQNASELAPIIPAGLDEDVAYEMAEPYADRAATYSIHEYLVDMDFIRPDNDQDADHILQNAINEATMFLAIAKVSRHATFFERKEQFQTALRAASETLLSTGVFSEIEPPRDCRRL